VKIAPSWLTLLSIKNFIKFAGKDNTVAPKFPPSKMGKADRLSFSNR